MALKVSINLLGAQALAGGTARDVLNLVVAADSAGIDVISLGDHLGFHRSAHQTRRKDHAFPYVLEEPWLEPIAFLAAAAVLTKQIRLSTFVLVAPLRPALLLAKQLATLDNLSNGRVLMGLGVGWQEEEFIANGMSFEGRFGDLEDMIVAMRALWGQPPAAAQGRNFKFDDFYSLPLPLQGSDMPLMLGLKPTAKNLDRMARLSQGWALNPADRPQFAESVRELKRLTLEHGRDAGALEFEVLQTPTYTADGKIDVSAIRASVQRDKQDGATIVSFPIRDFCKRIDEVEAFLKMLVSLKD